jgi:hypothetical protein
MIANQIAGFLGVASAVAATDYESIATVTVGSGGQANAEFTSIPSTYSHLQLRMFASTSGSYGGSFNMQINGNTSPNYVYHQVIGDGSAASAASSTTNGNIAIAIGAQQNTYFAGVVIDILDYKDTNKKKVIRSLYGVDTNGGGYVGMTSGMWTSDNNAVTSIKINPQGAVNLVQYSSFALYGIK